ncbi:hypothetical protein glysoja_028742, partial [Glycine soja]
LLTLSDFSTIRVLNIILVLFLLLIIVHVQPNLGTRVLNMENNPLRLQSLNKSPIHPSRPYGCTYILGFGGMHCPVKEMNANNRQR